VARLRKSATVALDRPRSSVTTDTADLLAAGSAILCLLHCLALPLAVVGLPLLAGIATASEDLHFWLLALALPTSMAALLMGWRRHRRAGPPSLGAIGLCLLVIGIRPDQPPVIELAATIAGGLSLLFAHLANWRLRRGG
jgi:hypothetical protein